VEVQGQALMLVRAAEEVRVYPATCPHRGADLCAGELSGDAVVCPFHRHRIGLGQGEFHVPRLSSVSAGGLVFGQLGPLGSDQDTGLEAHLQGLDEKYRIFEAFDLPVDVASDVVVENGFDQAHFKPVHRMHTARIARFGREPGGPFVASGKFELRAGAGPREIVRFEARAFSPHLVVAEYRGMPPAPYVSIAAAVPTAEDACLLRMSLGIPRDDPRLSASRFVPDFISRIREGIQPDLDIWNHMDSSVTPRLTAADAPLAGYRDFCRAFALGAD
jgi:hypothetical protein